MSDYLPLSQAEKEKISAVVERFKQESEQIVQDFKNDIKQLKIPPSENTDNKIIANIHTRAVTEDGAAYLRVVESVGDALLVDDDIPPCFKGA